MGSPPTSPLSPTSSGNMSFLSVAPLSPPILRSELGGVVKAHTDNLDRYIAEIEATEATGSLPTMPAKKQPKLPYIRRRYTGKVHSKQNNQAFLSPFGVEERGQRPGDLDFFP